MNSGKTAMTGAKQARIGLAIGLSVLGCSGARPPGSSPLGPGAGSAPPAAESARPLDGCALPARHSWASSGPIIAPVSDPKHDLVAIKDPTVVFFAERWHVYASSVSAGGVYGLVYLSFKDLSDPASGSFYYMDQTPGFAGYVAAPQLFYFAPKKLWYLVFQSGPPMYSTTHDPGKPETWTRPAPFFSKEPAIIAPNGGWLDFWVICDDARCHLFFSNDHGRFYRSVTSSADFPNGFSEPTVVLDDSEAGRLYEACNVYKLRGSNQYLSLIEAFDASSNGRRYFRSWTASSLDGPWVAQNDSGTAPFAGASNVSFSGQPWTKDISHGELIRSGYDQSLTIDACDLRFLHQGFDPAASGADYNKLPWRLGLLSAIR